MSRYQKVHAGEWIHPTGESYKMMCCDCGLVHRMQFRIVRYKGKSHIIFRAWRDNRATAATRRGQ